MTVEEKVLRYLDFASMPENLPYNTSYFMQELGISEEDVRRCQKQKEKELTLKPVEKRNLAVKQVLKPLLKKYGFSTAGSDWRRDIGDAYLIIHMMNSRFNSIPTGVSFRFHISASRKDKMKDKLSDQWIYNQACDLDHCDFLPFCGMLSPYYSGGMYQIDGYKNYLPSDTPVEAICEQLKEDWGNYILPELDAVESYEDFLELREQKKNRSQEKEVRLLRFYYAAQQCALEATGNGYNMLIGLKNLLHLTAEEILSHLEWLDVCRENSSFPKVDARELVRKVSEEGQG